MLCSAQLENPTIEEVEEIDGGGEDGESDGEEFNDNVSASEAGSGPLLSDLVFMLGDIANIISCLYTLSVAIRQPVPQDRLRKYAEIDLSHYEYFDNQHVLEKFPNAKPLLIQRLGNANTQRRQYLKYRSLHYEKIAKGLEGVERAIPVDKSIVPALDDVVEAVPDHADPGEGHHISSWGTTDHGAETVITSTTISIVPKSAVVPALDTIEAESDEGQTATSFGTIMETSDSEVKLLKVPDPPDADHVFAGNAFQCPYCFSLIIVKNSKAWQYASISQNTLQ